jgi:hypothetical protein
MGVWTENLSLPAVINECMLHSHEGVIRLFPNTTNLGRASFRDLRAAGAFLVSAAWDGKSVSRVMLKSEKGAIARVVSPWTSSTVRTDTATVDSTLHDGVLEFATRVGESYNIVPR